MSIGVQRLSLPLSKLVERVFIKRRHFRAMATRFEKRDANCLDLVELAAARLWTRATTLLADGSASDNPDKKRKDQKRHDHNGRRDK